MRTYLMPAESRSFAVPFTPRVFFTPEPVLALIKYGGGRKWGDGSTWGQQLPAISSTNLERTFMASAESRVYQMPGESRTYTSPEES